MKESKALITARQKVIRIVDLSEYGWATVEEDELADNSDDEKRLYRAELHAGRKVKAAAAKSKKKKDNFRKEWRPRYQQGPLDSQGISSPSLSQQSSSSASTSSVRDCSRSWTLFYVGRWDTLEEHALWCKATFPAPLVAGISNEHAVLLIVQMKCCFVTDCVDW